MIRTEKKLKVLHLNASSGGGAAIVAQRLNDALNKSGLIESKHLIYSGFKTENNVIWANTWIKKKYAFFLHALEKLHFLFFEKNKTIRFSFSTGKTGIDIVNNTFFKEADVIHLHWINKGFISLNGLEKIANSGKKIVWTLHDAWAFTGGCYYFGTCNNYKFNCVNCKYIKSNAADKFAVKYKAKKQQIFATNTIKFITPSHWLKKVGHNAGFPENFINSIFNTLGNFNDKGIKNSYNPKVFTIMCSAVNFNDFRKGGHLLLPILEQLKAVNFKIKISVIGKNVPKEILDLDVETTFAGYIDSEKILLLLAETNLFLCTSLEDNLPTTIAESMAVGVPVAAFNIGGVGEMIQHNNTGLLAAEGNVQEMADLINRFIENYNETEYLNYQKACLQFCASQYSSEIIVQKHLSLYLK